MMEDNIMETKKTIQIPFVILLIAIVIALLVGIVATFMPELLISRSFPLYTDNSWDDFIMGNPLAGNYVLIKERMMGVQVLAASIGGIFILFTAYRKVEKWAWYCILLVTVIVFGSALIEGMTFNNPPVIIISLIGLVLVATGSIISARTFLSDNKK
jgi:hypothetical protein